MSTSTYSILDPTTVLGALFYGILVILFAWMIGSVFNVFIHRYLDRAQAAGSDSTSVRFLGQLARVVVYVKVNGCFVTDISKEGVSLMFSAMCFDPGDIASIRSDLLLDVKKRLDAAGVVLG